MNATKPIFNPEHDDLKPSDCITAWQNAVILVGYPAETQDQVNSFNLEMHAAFYLNDILHGVD